MNAINQLMGLGLRFVFKKDVEISKPARDFMKLWHADLDESKKGQLFSNCRDVSGNNPVFSSDQFAF